MARYWYGYLGGAVTDPSNYTILVPQTPAAACSNGHTLCSIYSPPNPLDETKPAVVSTRIQNYIPLATGTVAGPYPTANPFVFPKP